MRHAAARRVRRAGASRRLRDRRRPAAARTVARRPLSRFPHDRSPAVKDFSNDRAFVINTRHFGRCDYLDAPSCA
jgi:hypothetical protein